MNGKVFSYGLAALVGFLVAIAYYELNSHESDGDLTDADSGSAPIGTLEINSPGAQGSVDVYKNEGALILEVDIESTAASELRIMWENKDWEFKSISNQASGAAPGFLFAKGNFGVSSSTEKKFRIEFSLPEQSEGGPDGDFHFIISQNRIPLFQGSLSL